MSAKGDRIIHGNKLSEVIMEQLRHALADEGVVASDEAEFYLVNLLSDYHTAENLSVFDEARPLSIVFLEALSKSKNTKLAELKRIGDGTLIGLGFFHDIIRKGIVDRSYYLTIGGLAYDSLSEVVAYDSQFHDVYSELSAKFSNLVEVLAHIAPWNRAKSDKELMMIYRRWVESGDERLGELLKKAGILTDQN
jgi:hypothetical protein